MTGEFSRATFRLWLERLFSPTFSRLFVRPGQLSSNAKCFLCFHDAARRRARLRRRGAAATAVQPEAGCSLSRSSVAWKKSRLPHQSGRQRSSYHSIAVGASYFFLKWGSGCRRCARVCPLGLSLVCLQAPDSSAECRVPSAECCVPVSRVRIWCQPRAREGERTRKGGGLPAAMEGASDEARREPLAAGTRDDATACAREEERPPPPAAPAARAASAPMPGPVAADAGAESEDSEYDFDAEGFAFPFDECSTVPFGTLCAQTPFAISPAQAYQRALALARVDDRDTVVDLGCGDGAVLLAHAWAPHASARAPGGPACASHARTVADRCRPRQHPRGRAVRCVPISPPAAAEGLPPPPPAADTAAASRALRCLRHLSYKRRRQASRRRTLSAAR